MQTTRSFPAVLAIALLACSFLPSQAQELVTLLPSAANANQDFGFSVDIFGDVAVVGAQRDDDGLTLERGAAFVFRFEGPGWTEEAKLQSSTQNAFNWFGWDVAVSGDVILAAERNGDELSINAGNVNVFRYNHAIFAWEQEAVLTPPSGMAGEDFGFAVDVDGDVAVVGAPTKNGVQNQEGAVYVFRYSGVDWVEDGMLKASDPGLQDLFGSAVAVDGNRIVVGAFNADDSTSNQGGKTYVFEHDGDQWSETAILQSNQSNNIANMGASVALDGDWIASGVPNDNELQFGAGSVIVHHFEDGAWNFHSKLLASDGTGFYLFGTSVALDDTTLVVGAENWAPTGGNSTGKAYVFSFDAAEDEWIAAEEGIVPDGGGAGDEFGQSVASHNGAIVIGAPDYGGPGAAFVFGEPKEATSAEQDLPIETFSVSDAYPNPFTNSASLTITASVDGPVRVSLHDVLGRQVRALFEGYIARSVPTRIRVDAHNQPAGLYWIRVESANETVSRSVVVMH